MRLPQSEQNTPLRPVASPVDTFVRAAQPAQDGGGLLEIARSLSALSPTLASLSGEARILDNQRQDEDARRRAAIATARSWAEAVEKGEVEAGASPVFQRAWQETRGRALVAEFGQRAEQAWLAPDNADRNSDDPQAIARFIQAQRTAFMEGMTPDMQRGFLSRAGAVEERLNGLATTERNRRTEANAMQSLEGAMMAAIESGLRAGMSPGDAIRAAQSESITLRFAGLGGDRVNEALGRSIMAVAHRTDRTDLLDAATRTRRPDVTRPGQDVAPLGGAQWADRFETARTAMMARRNAADQRTQLNEERFGRQRAQQAAADFNNSVLRAHLEGRELPLPDADTLRAVGRYDPDFATRQLQLRSSLQQMGQQQDMRTIGQIRADVMAAENPQEHLTHLMRTGQFTDSRFLQDLSVTAERATEGRSFVLSMDGVRSVQYGLTRSSAPEISITRPLFARANSIAEQFFITEMTRWAVEYQNANPQRRPTPAEATAKALELRQMTDAFVTTYGDKQDVMRSDFWRPGQPLPLTAPAAAPPPPRGGSPGSPGGNSPARPQRPQAASQAAPAAPLDAPPAAPPAPAVPVRPAGANMGDPVATYIQQYAGRAFTPPPDRRPSVEELDALQRALVSPNRDFVTRALARFDERFGEAAAAHYLNPNRNR